MNPGRAQCRMALVSICRNDAIKSENSSAIPRYIRLLNFINRLDISCAIYDLSLNPRYQFRECVVLVFHAVFPSHIIDV